MTPTQIHVVQQSQPQKCVFWVLCHDSIAWYCMVLHGIAWCSMILYGLHGIALHPLCIAALVHCIFCTLHHGIAW